MIKVPLSNDRKHMHHQINEHGHENFLKTLSECAVNIVSLPILSQFREAVRPTIILHVLLMSGCDRKAELIAYSRFKSLYSRKEFNRNERHNAPFGFSFSLVKNRRK